ncbi:putative nucleotidyltransferase substrate binding domain-containing protein [Vibrio genomosp. F10]|uniref:Cyclic nucleotide-binding protein n=2 Tax=Vibrio genomosp. F10 TaxID=723171 RepID=A0A1B9QXU5_9VIBR|nr:putative nucleotidyltransferase substrate binding domain-containing protein [Vibrio genomosp. F10]OCH74872.1 cyclic nucleotide-binding protein [Vibrio genomosp. F10]OEE32625.1 cyclic nucleotide-binding protein [Vibrio genomosp. F10 str. ZF-129]OEE96547.1 cyclic nucleotide-binding protein [Vibrio genomosp. F10 str. 9ZC157]OEF07651.1 cyclic nucleotide-binding protein [Vibrio genomosp. F10 str. 9ZB36]
MEAELLEIQNFLSQRPPFDDLPPEVLEHVTKHVEISYFRKDTPIIHFGDNINDLYIVRSGIVEVYRRKGELYNRIDEGAVFGQMGLLTNNKVRFPAKAIEDTLLYCLPEAIFQELYDNHDSFADFVEVEDNARLRQTVSSTEDDNDLTTCKVRTLLTRDVLFIAGTETIQQAAIKMAEENVSSLLIIDQNKLDNDDSDDSPVLGIITDRDLCTRVIAEGLDANGDVASVMTTEVISLDHNAYVYEAMLTMLRYNVHHLPVLKDRQPIGIIEATDIVRYESQNSLLLVSSIFQQQTIEELVQISEQVKDSFVRLVNEDANSHMVGTAMSVIGRSFKQRIIELAEQELGPAPVQYCFLALGSMGRDEQLIVTDQDNAIILDDSYIPEKHNAYFEKFARFVCDGLAMCGYTLCTGDIMATNPDWRMTRREWEECFSDWIDDPNPKALLNSSIFFDLDGVYGRLKWAEQLNSFIVRRAKKNNRFLACLARNALNRTPPLGFFKDFVMEKDGRHNNSINLKRRGTAPLADLIRVHALAVGSRSTNSFERLDDIIDAGILPKGRAQDLRDAMEFISMVRIRHQAIDVENEIEPDNNIEPENLSDFERRNLKDAFQILSNAQNFLKFRYQASSSFK